MFLEDPNLKDENEKEEKEEVYCFFCVRKKATTTVEGIPVCDICLRRKIPNILIKRRLEVS